MLFPRFSLFAGLVLLCMAGMAEVAQGQPSAKVMVADVQIKKLPATSELVGTVRPNRASVISSEVAGLVADFPVREGDFVKRGALICRLNDDTLRLDLEAATSKLNSLLSRIEITEAELQRWAFEKKRIERLTREHKANDKEVADTEASYLVALNSAKEAKQKLAEQTAIVELKKADLIKTAILAPFDGYIIELYSEIGEWVSVGGEIVRIIDIKSVLVRINAPESAFPFILVGDQTPVKICALNSFFSGKIKHVIPEADERSRTFPVNIEIANTDYLLKSGMFARVTIRSGSEIESVAVPKDAVVQQDGVNRVWIVHAAGPQGKQAAPLVVTLGAEVGEWVAVTSGNISAQMKVVVRGNERLMPFPMPVQIVHEETLLSTPSTNSSPE